MSNCLDYSEDHSSAHHPPKSSPQVGSTQSEPDYQIEMATATLSGRTNFLLRDNCNSPKRLLSEDEEGEDFTIEKFFEEPNMTKPQGKPVESRKEIWTCRKCGSSPHPFINFFSYLIISKATLDNHQTSIRSCLENVKLET